jgi:hypothetical protein
MPNMRLANFFTFGTTLTTFSETLVLVLMSLKFQKHCAFFFSDNGHQYSLLVRELNFPAAFYNFTRYRTFKTAGEEIATGSMDNNKSLQARNTR